MKNDVVEQLTRVAKVAVVNGEPLVIPNYSGVKNLPGIGNTKYLGEISVTSSAASESTYGSLVIPANTFTSKDFLEFKLVGVTDDIASTVRVRYTINSTNIDMATAMSFTTRIGGIGSLAEDPLTNDVAITEFHGCHNTTTQLHRINSVDTNAVHPLTGEITITLLIASPNTSATINVKFYKVNGQ